MRELTLEDIALQVGVSRSTVSRVVNDHPNVSEDVRKRVQEVIKSTGYHPNVAARILASQRSLMLGLVLPRSVSSFFDDPYFPLLIQGIAQSCNQYDYTLGLFLIATKEDEEKIFPRVSRKGLLDGVLVQSGCLGEQLLDCLADSNMPCVIIGRPLNCGEISYVDVDNINASYHAVNYLIHEGYRRIGMISGSPDSAVSIDRKNGYRKALLDQGWSLNDSFIIDGDFTESSGYFAMQKLLSEKPDAIFAASDIMAIGAMRAVQEEGLRVPDDVAFVGFDDLPLSTTVNPQLTTVRQPVREIGIQAVEILIDLIENGIKPARRVIMNTELIIRGSCSIHQRAQ